MVHLGTFLSSRGRHNLTRSSLQQFPKFVTTNELLDDAQARETVAENRRTMHISGH